MILKHTVNLACSWTMQTWVYLTYKTAKCFLVKLDRGQKMQFFEVRFEANVTILSPICHRA